MLLGWFDENDQRVSFERTVITGDMTLTAKWASFEDITYTGVIGGTGIAITLMDRNLGATSNNINDPSSDGYYYQYGNNYGFEREKIFNHETPITTGQANIS
ncbi:MAG: hypothetical protein K6E76_01940 [Patescibacteria group bacterium]|nr:hypothetical protein [Patescibacteria group bacterium]